MTRSTVFEDTVLRALSTRRTDWFDAERLPPVFPTVAQSLPTSRQPGTLNHKC